MFLIFRRSDRDVTAVNSNGDRNSEGRLNTFRKENEFLWICEKMQQ